MNTQHEPYVPFTQPVPLKPVHTCLKIENSEIITKINHIVFVDLINNPNRFILTQTSSIFLTEQ